MDPMGITVDAVGLPPCEYGRQNSNRKLVNDNQASKVQRPPIFEKGNQIKGLSTRSGRNVLTNKIYV